MAVPLRRGATADRSGGAKTTVTDPQQARSVDVKAFTPPLGLVTMWTPDRSITLLAQLGDGAWQVNQGGNAWEEVELPRRTSSTVWKGRPPIALSGSLLFDGLRARQPVDAAVRTLLKLAGIGAGVLNPTFLINAAGAVPFDATTHPTLRWFIDGTPEFADDGYRDVSGRLLRQTVNVTLKNYRADQVLLERSAATRFRTAAGKPARPAHRRYTVHKGDTLVKIAKREYDGDVDRWSDIAKANGLRDPRKALKPGTVLRLP